MKNQSYWAATGMFVIFVGAVASPTATALDPEVRGEGMLGWVFDALGMKDPCWETGSKVSFAQALWYVGEAPGDGDAYQARDWKAFGIFTPLGQTNNLYDYEIKNGIAYDYADCKDPGAWGCDQLPLEFRCKYQGLPPVPSI